MFDSLLTMLGISKGSALGGALGAAVSLKFIEGNWWQRLTTAAGGWVCAAYLTPLAIDISEINLTERNELGVGFLIGVLGMSLIAQILKAIPEWATALKVRVFGKSSPENGEEGK